MSDICNILGVSFNNITHNEAVELICDYLQSDKKCSVYTPNPEIVMAAQKDSEFMRVLKDSTLTVPDGIGVVYGSKFTKNKLKERVAGYDLVQGVFDRMKDMSKTAYFFGGAPEVAELAKQKMEIKYPGLKIVGTADGYFDDVKEKRIIEDINRLCPDLLLVGIGFPKQEKWIDSHIDSLNVKVAIGVGGSFDVMSGRVQRAPDIFIKLGLEWFHRLITQPSRFVRMLQLPLFMLTVIFTGNKGKR